MVQVTVVEGVVFGDQADGSHNVSISRRDAEKKES